VTRNGIKVLDFGLAKLASDDSLMSSASAVTDAITSQGALVGTLHYMSPEQVEAKDADARSDIFSFGVVLYEMVTGHRPFVGDSSASLLASILRDQPPSISQRQPAVPRAVERVIRKCLEKRPDDRWQSARDLKPTLELIDLDAPVASSSSASEQVVAPVRSRRAWLWPAIAVLGIVLAAGTAWIAWPKAPPAVRVTRFEVSLPPGAQVLAQNFYVRVSPDGSKLAFTTLGAGIWIRDLESLEARLLPGTEGAIAPFWSPDNRSVAFGVGNRLMRVEISGGPPQVLCQSEFMVGSGVWTDQGEIVFGHRGEGTLMRVSASGGVATRVTALAEGETSHALPSLLPDGRQFLYLRGQERGALFAGSLDVKPEAQPLQPIAPAELGVTFVKSANPVGGDLFFVRNGTLMAQPFDWKTLRLTGEPVSVVEQIGRGPLHAHFSVTSGGVMAYRTGPGTKNQLTWLDRAGKTEQKLGEPGDPATISLSPDERQVSIVRLPASNPSDIWLLDLARGIESRFTTGAFVRFDGDYGVVWSPDGKQLAYAAQGDVYVKDASGASDARLIKDVVAVVTDWTRDGRFLIVTPPSGEGILALALENGEATQVSKSGFGGRLSPDNKWIAYYSLQSGRPEVFVRPFAPPGGPPAPSGPVIQISKDGGGYPMWRGDGKELFFRGLTQSMSAQIESASDTFKPSAPVALPIALRIASPWTVTRGGQRFLVAQPLDQGVQTPITVVTNWEAALKR
jgi:Tol biopolymer transport system component